MLILFIYNILKHLAVGVLKVQLNAQCNVIFMIAITLTLEPINCDEKHVPSHVKTYTNDFPCLTGILCGSRVTPARF